jgi:Zn-finger nucleic acid-binding protein
MPARETDVACPSCKGRLLLFDAPRGVLAGCADCGGLWLDNIACRAAISAVLSPQARDFVQRVTAQHADPAADYRSPGRSSADALRCPGCGTALVRTHLEEAAVDIDVCGAHGAWFDRTELWRVIQWAELKTAADDIDVRQMTALINQATRDEARRTDGWGRRR